MKNDKNRVLIFVLLVSGFFLCSCQSVNKEILPDGFAAYRQSAQSAPFRAVSPDGVMFSVRTEPNEPYAELSFWKLALKKHLLDSGYHFIRESDIQSGSEYGYMLEVSAPVDNQDYIYACAIFVQNDKIIIAEAAGEVLNYEKRRKAVLAAVSKLRNEKRTNQALN